MKKTVSRSSSIRPQLWSKNRIFATYATLPFLVKCPPSSCLRTKKSTIANAAASLCAPFVLPRRSVGFQKSTKKSTECVTSATRWCQMWTLTRCIRRACSSRKRHWPRSNTILLKEIYSWSSLIRDSKSISRSFRGSWSRSRIRKPRKGLSCRKERRLLLWNKENMKSYNKH